MEPVVKDIRLVPMSHWAITICLCHFQQVVTLLLDLQITPLLMRLIKMIFLFLKLVERVSWQIFL